MLSRPKPPRVYWDAEVGWCCDTNFALGPRAVVNLIAWTKKIQLGRMRDRTPEVREQMQSALDSLSPSTLKINLLPECSYGQDRILYSPPSDDRSRVRL